MDRCNAILHQVDRGKRNLQAPLCNAVYITPELFAQLFY